jgi:hypothetical protein
MLHIFQSCSQLAPTLTRLILAVRLLQAQDIKINGIHNVYFQTVSKIQFVNILKYKLSLAWTFNGSVVRVTTYFGSRVMILPYSCPVLMSRYDKLWQQAGNVRSNNLLLSQGAL